MSKYSRAPSHFAHRNQLGTPAKIKHKDAKDIGDYKTIVATRYPGQKTTFTGFKKKKDAARYARQAEKLGASTLVGVRGGARSSEQRQSVGKVSLDDMQERSKDRFFKEMSPYFRGAQYATRYDEVADKNYLTVRQKRTRDGKKVMLYRQYEFKPNNTMRLVSVREVVV